jgi:hypothetical protein
MAATNPNPEPAPEPAEPVYSLEVRDLLLRADQGDQTVLPALRRLLDKHPELWRQFGDLAQQARSALLTWAAGKSLVVAESVRRRLKELHAELAGPAPAPLEKLLVERVVQCWAQCQLADLDAVHKEGAGVFLAGHALRRQTAAHHRYLAAIRQLAVVRKLLKPVPTALELLRFPVEETDGRPPTGRHASPYRNGTPVPN